MREEIFSLGRFYNGTWEPNCDTVPEFRFSGGRFSIRGHAAVFYRNGDATTEYVLRRAKDGTPRAVERIMPQAFDRLLNDSRIDCLALFNHAPSYVLGRRSNGTLRLSADSKGLFYEIDTPETSIAQDVLTLLRRGDLRGSSFAFHARGERWEKSGDVSYRLLTDLDVTDISVVSSPAYASAEAQALSVDGQWRSTRSVPPSSTDELRIMCAGASPLARRLAGAQERRWSD